MALMSISLTHVIFLGIIFASCWLFWGLQIIMFNQFWQFRNENFFRARRPEITRVFYWFICVGLGFIYPIILATHTLHLLTGDGVPFFAAEILHELYLIGIASIGFLRMYIMWYDHKFHQAVFDTQWKSRIMYSSGNNKYMLHRQQWGSAIYISKILAVFGVVTSMTVFVLSLTITDDIRSIYIVTRLVFVGPLIILLLVCYCKLSPVTDIYKIGDEMKLVAATMLTILVMNVTLIWVPAEFVDEIDFSVQVLQSFVLIVVQTYYVVRLYDRECVSLEKMMSGKGGDASPSAEWKLHDVFNQEVPAKQLMRHCVEELSVENVLFLVELLQYRSHLYNNLGVPEPQAAYQLKYVIENHAEVYVSDSIGDANMEHMQREILTSCWLPHNEKYATGNIERVESLSGAAREQPLPDTQSILDEINELSTNLFVKYIRRDAPLCLNLAYESRLRLEQFFMQTDDGKSRFVRKHFPNGTSKADMTVGECEFLYHAFDEAFDEMFNVMKRDTFVRFQLAWGKQRPHGPSVM